MTRRDNTEGQERAKIAEQLEWVRDFLMRWDEAEKAENAPQFTTRDLAFLIRDFIENAAMHHFEELEDGELSETDDEVEIVDIDMSDPHNMKVLCENGQCFRVSIVSIGAE